jgi:hypothetical protein
VYLNPSICDAMMARLCVVPNNATACKSIGALPLTHSHTYIMNLVDYKDVPKIPNKVEFAATLENNLGQEMPVGDIVLYIPTSRHSNIKVGRIKSVKKTTYYRYNYDYVSRKYDLDVIHESVHTEVLMEGVQEYQSGKYGKDASGNYEWITDGTIKLNTYGRYVTTRNIFPLSILDFNKLPERTSGRWTYGITKNQIAHLQSRMTTHPATLPTV